MNHMSWLWMSDRVVTFAAAGGHLDCLDYALASGCMVPIEALAEAARNGHAEVMRRIYASRNRQRYGMNWSSLRVQVAAAASGHLDCLKCALSHESTGNPSVAVAAAKGGHLECLAYAFQSGCALSTLSNRVTDAAARNGHLACLAFGHINGCLCDIYTADVAARGGHAECLDYLLGTAKCPTDSQTWVAAVTKGNIACLEVMSAHNAAPSRDTRHAMCSAAVEYGHAHVLSWIIGQLGDFVDKSHLAARLGRLNCLRVVAAAGPTSIDDDSIAAAAAGGHIECIDFLCAAGFPMDERACASAAKGGHLKCLSYLRRTLKCPWDEGACIQAVWGGHLDCLIYLHENGSPWAHATVVAAIRAGRVDCLTYALDRGCPHDAYAACVEAIKCNEAQCLDALCGAGAPLDQHLLAKAIHSGDTKLVGVLVRRQCPRGGVTCHEAEYCSRPRMLCLLYKSGLPWGPSRKIAGHTQKSVRAMITQPAPFVRPSEKRTKNAERGRTKGKAKKKACEGMMTASIAL
nr:ankyrin repeat [Pandoravirus massiliensis]